LNQVAFSTKVEPISLSNAATVSAHMFRSLGTSNVHSLLGCVGSSSDDFQNVDALRTKVGSCVTPEVAQLVKEDKLAQLVKEDKFVNTVVVRRHLATTTNSSNIADSGDIDIIATYVITQILGCTFWRDQFTANDGTSCDSIPTTLNALFLATVAAIAAVLQETAALLSGLANAAFAALAGGGQAPLSLPPPPSPPPPPSSPPPPCDICGDDAT
jgi:hypothetical protein